MEGGSDYIVETIFDSNLPLIYGFHDVDMFITSVVSQCCAPALLPPFTADTAVMIPSLSACLL